MSMSEKKLNESSDEQENDDASDHFQNTTPLQGQVAGEFGKSLSHMILGSDNDI